MVIYLPLIPFVSVSESAILTKSLTFGILFSSVVRAAVVAKLVILGISPLTSFLSVKSRISSYVSNTSYFAFSRIYFSIKSSISS